ncbi:hypothetical protein M422DRAFT_271194 [Sphaerobolus stellatus SS14]|uniref:F-box domain-containing protein n=1 Tax=Sphaerobolus stellatus (strain SS14) TaxID=990650 RepID=A0A0C9U0R3_SPHS4|nr:hypothetical protein M422DRAFT_271194 [Sphaerobolus stellatus SS14]
MNGRAFLAPTDANSLLDLSDELLELILGYIDDPKDVYSAGLTSKVLYKIAIPFHLQLRRIRCDQWNENLWRQFLNQNILAANVRWLEIDCGIPIGSPRERVPAFLVEPQSSRITNSQMHPVSLPTAVSKMSNLNRFCWREYRNTNDIVVKQTFDAVSKFCPDLEELHIEYHWHDKPSSDLTNARQEHLCPLPWQQLPCLKSLTIIAQCFYHACCHHPFYNILVTKHDLLLQDIYLDIHGFMTPHGDSNIERLFQLAYWPNLRRFTLLPSVAIWEDIQTPLFTEFLRRHTTLQALYLPDPNPFLIPGILPDDGLPALKAIQFPLYSSPEDRCPIPDRIAARLWHFGPKLTDYHLDFLERMPALRACHFKPTSAASLSEFVDIVPNIERLHCEGMLMAITDVDMAISVGVSHIQILSRFRRLTHLGSFFTNSITDITTVMGDRLLRVAAVAIPSLIFVQICVQKKLKWVRVKRDTQGNYIGYTFAQKVPELRDRYWGDFFIGLMEGVREPA